MDNSGITHNTKIDGYEHPIQTHVTTGWIILDLNGLNGAERPLKLGTVDAERIVAILQAAIDDKEKR